MRIVWVLALLLLAAAVAGWQAESRAAIEQRLLLRTLVVKAEALGTLSHGRSSAHFWGSGCIENLRFQPGEALRARYGLPADLSLAIPRLCYRDWDDHAPLPRQVEVRFEQLNLSLPEPLPTQFSGKAGWDYHLDTGLLRARLQLNAPAAAAIESSITLKLDQPQSFAGATLATARMDYEDQGLAQGARAQLALQSGADPRSGDAALARQLLAWLSDRGLPADDDMQTALRRFASDPTRLTLRLDPPGNLRPATLPQFAPADRAAALGLRIENR